MERLQISLEPELDEQLGRAAARKGVSKPEIVRRLLREALRSPAPLEEDPLIQLLGAFAAGEAGDSEDHDRLIDSG
jgi:metal-responsive CopG/Arc/MetJ family transcriptional regulator